MATVAENLFAYLKTVSSIKDIAADRLFYNAIAPQSESRPFLFVVRSATRHERCLGDAQGEVPFSHTFAIECVADDPLVGQQLADAVRTIDGVNDATLGRVFVDEQDDDYDPVVTARGDVRQVVSLSVEVIP